MGSDGVTPPLLITEPNTTMMRVKGELKKQLWLSAPLIGVSLLQYSLQVISVMFVGHLGSLPLSAASIATSFASVTGFTFLEKHEREQEFVINGILFLPENNLSITFLNTTFLNALQ
uniref:Uncharacterized protein n=1 Tax=Brassica oleracea var. oleracea TaxID=109376 RepID=A0A0D3D0F3_BRAOL